MEILKTICWVVQLLSAIAVVALILLQHGKGADAGATFGSSGGSGSLFGASGASSFLSRSTAIMATIFFITTFALVLLISNQSKNDLGVMSGFTAKPSTAKTVIPSNPNKIDASTTTAVINSKKIGASSTMSTESKGKFESGKNQIPQ